MTDEKQAQEGPRDKGEAFAESVENLDDDAKNVEVSPDGYAYVAGEGGGIDEGEQSPRNPDVAARTVDDESPQLDGEITVDVEGNYYWAVNGRTGGPFTSRSGAESNARDSFTPDAPTPANISFALVDHRIAR